MRLRSAHTVCDRHYLSLLHHYFNVFQDMAGRLGAHLRVAPGRGIRPGRIQAGIHVSGKHGQYVPYFDTELFEYPDVYPSSDADRAFCLFDFGLRLFETAFSREKYHVQRAACHDDDSRHHHDRASVLYLRRHRLGGYSASVDDPGYVRRGGVRVLHAAVFLGNPRQHHRSRQTGRRRLHRHFLQNHGAAFRTRVARAGTFGIYRRR